MNGFSSIKVGNVEKHNEGFVSYLVNAHVTREDFQVESVSIRRRYQDFLWLHDSLASNYSYIFIPPLPKKAYTADNFSPTFIEQRKWSLQKFLERIASHYVLSNSENFKLFLTATNWELLTVKKEHEKLSIGKFGESMKSLYRNIGSANKSEFGDMLVYINDFSPIISNISDNFDNLMKSTLDISNINYNLKTNYDLWVHSECNHSRIFDSMSMIHDFNKDMLTKLKENFNYSIVILLREYCCYSDSIKECIKNFDEVSFSLKTVETELTKKETEKQKIVAGEKSIQTIIFNPNDHLSNIEESIQELSMERNSLRDKNCNAKEQLNNEIDSWKHQKRDDLKSVLLLTSNNFIHCLEDMIENLEKSQSVINDA